MEQIDSHPRPSDSPVPDPEVLAYQEEVAKAGKPLGYEQALDFIQHRRSQKMQEAELPLAPIHRAAPLLTPEFGKSTNHLQQSSALIRHLIEAFRSQFKPTFEDIVYGLRWLGTHNYAYHAVYATEKEGGDDFEYIRRKIENLIAGKSPKAPEKRRQSPPTITDKDDDFPDDVDVSGDYNEEAFEDIDFKALGIDPNKPTPAKPGSEEKVLMLAARYAAGIPLWHDRDCYEHGPGVTMIEFLRPQLPVVDLRRRH